MTTKIKATNIWKKFNNLEVLKGIDLEVNEGEVVAVIGPSGGGKSTLLRCLNKLETIDKGSITIDGEELCRETSGGTEYVKNNDVRRIACKMGMVFQQFNLFPHMTVLENLIEAPVNVRKRDKAEVIKEAEVLHGCQYFKAAVSFFPCHFSTSILCTISMIVSSFPIRVNHPLLYRTKFSVQKISTCEPLQAGCSLTAKIP